MYCYSENLNFLSIVGNTVLEPMELADKARLTIDCYMNKKDSLV